MITRTVRGLGLGQTGKYTLVDLNSANRKVTVPTYGQTAMNTLVSFLPAYPMVMALTHGQTEGRMLANGNTIKWTGMELSHLPTEEFGPGNFSKAHGLMETNMPPGKHHQSSHHGRTAKPKPNHKYDDPSILQHSHLRRNLKESLPTLYCTNGPKFNRAYTQD